MLRSNLGTARKRTPAPLWKVFVSFSERLRDDNEKVTLFWMHRRYNKLY